ncbi:TolC family protein [Pedobacter nutrimenti]|uniref:TolC family protein n=1 Tax=Pedobacter nutrimenti TaxID=1241337 RepID=UPI0029305880|nr:TolC family protein [Pedobacter nutrimenti]
MENWRYTMFSINKWTFLLLLLPVSLLAQQTPVKLDTILNRIEKNNLLLQTYALKAESYKYKAKAGTAWMAPMVGVGTFMTPYPGQTVMDDRDKGSVMLQLEQDIPNPAKQNAQKRYIESKGDVEMAGRAIAMNTFKAQAKSLYYTWIVASQRIQILQENDKIMQMMKKIEQIRYPYNQSQLSGVYKASAKIEENQNMIRMQQGDIAKAKAWLNSLMNLPGNQELEIDTNFTPKFIPESGLDTTLLARQRKDILQMEQNIRSMKLGVGAMKAQAKPDFKLRFDHMSPLGGMMPKAYSVMGMISIPIAPWASRMYKSEVKAMNYEIQAMEKERSGMLQESQGMLYGMQYEIQSMEKRIAAMEDKIVPALKKTMDADFANYQENKLQITAVMGSWEALTMMQNNVLDEKMKLYQMIIDYEKELYR